MNSLQAIPGPMPKTPEWDALRLFDPARTDRPVVFGASDAAAACNQSSYSSALQLYLEKRGEFDPHSNDTAEDVERREFGLDLEPVILRRYARREKCQITADLPAYLHPTLPFMAVTPDAIAGLSDGTLRGVEAKNSGAQMFDPTGENVHRYGVEDTDQVPIEYLLQCQQNMEVMGYDQVDMPVLRGGNRLLVYRIDRSPELIQQIVSAEQELAERIVNGDPPEPNWTHSGTQKVLERMYGLEIGRRIELDEEAMRVWNLLQEMKAEEKDREERMRGYRNLLLEKLRGAEIGVLPNRTHELKRSVIADSYVTEKDVSDLQLRLGQVKRAGHERLSQRKVK